MANVMPAVRRLLFEQHRDGVVVLDGECRLIDLNPAARRLLGVEEPVHGTAAAGLLPFWPQVAAAVEGADGQPVEIAHGGNVLEVRCTPIRDARRQTIGRLVVLHDVTEHSRLIRELNAYARTVAHDLKNPLSAASGYLDLVRMAEPELANDLSRKIGKGEEIAEQMFRIIDQLLRRSLVRQ